MNRKFIQTLDRKTYARLSRLAREQGTTIQQLIRVVIVPGWVRDIKAKKRKK